MWNINWLEIGLAALAGFMVGGIWYGPLFGKVWQRLSGLSDEKIRSGNQPLIFGATFVLNLMAALMLAHMYSANGNPGLKASVMIGFGIGLFFVATSICVNYLFSRKSVGLMLIDGGYWTVIYTVMGAIFGAIG